MLKEEFRLEVGMYLRYIKKQQPRRTAEIVSMSKYKLSILGLEKAFVFAEKHERLLQEGDTGHNNQFMKILESINSFLAKV